MSKDPKTWECERKMLIEECTHQKEFDRWNITSFEYLWLGAMGYYGLTARQASTKSLSDYIMWFNSHMTHQVVFGLDFQKLKTILEWSYGYAVLHTHNMSQTDEYHTPTVDQSNQLYLGFHEQMEKIFGVEWA